MKKTFFVTITLILLISLAPTTSAHSTPADQFSGEVAISWFDLQLDLAKSTPGFTPPVVSRALAYSGVALYEAVVPGMPGYQSLEGAVNGLRKPPQPIEGVEYDWRVVANSTLYEMTHYLYANTSAENLDKIEALYISWQEQFADEVDPVVLRNSMTQGRITAEAMFVWSLTDGGYQGQLYNFPDNYIAPEGSGLWVPTKRREGDPLPGLQPYWGENRTFVIQKDQECSLVPPPEYSEEEGTAFYNEAYEVYDTVQHLTPEQQEIALFWSDDPGLTPTPPGHSISILNQVLLMEDASLALAAEAYARMGMSQADSFIVCWYYKYHYNLVRPVTYINNLIDPEWETPVETPPFPEYPSGHSVQAGAAAEVLTQLFGDDYAFTDHTHDERGLAPRSFDSFYAFADEAAISRLYGGIHYRAAIELGVDIGKCIGRQISEVPLKTD